MCVSLGSDAREPTAEPVLCEFCGFEIEYVGQECPALDDGRCQS
ncbi:hypothetical protein [Halobaculum roseum]